LRNSVTDLVCDPGRADNISRSAARRTTPIKVRQNRYPNSIIEQDHRAIKCIIRPMMGFKVFRCARIILSGIDVMHMIRKGQLNNGGGSRAVAEKFDSLFI
jgi:putative transposase